jgi:beta-lactamase regulating signal transducer with metallopeptidase domain
MDLILASGLVSIKALLLLTSAGGIAFALRHRPARVRAAIWGTALVGSLLIPAVSTVVPTLSVELPTLVSELVVDSRPIDGRPTQAFTAPVPPPASGAAVVDRTRPAVTDVSRPTIGLGTVLLAVWGLGSIVMLVHQCVGLWRMSRIVARARLVRDSNWSVLLDEVKTQLGRRRPVRLLSSGEVDVPAVYGLVRPVVILPAHSTVWLEDRRTAVLQHELVHIIRFDWIVRVAARIARAVYWFNPLAWWAVRRLDLEQELACDEEVLALGSRASTYACHLLGIARAAVAAPTLSQAGLAMARRSHLEARIMSILKPSKHRKIGLAVILPAVLVTAALVPAIAAVQPTEPGPREASDELKTALAEMREVEQRLEPHLEKIELHQVDLEPVLEMIEDLEIDIDHEAFARIEAEMAPILEQIHAIEIDMEPFHEQMEVVHEALEGMTFHIDDGTLKEVQRQIREQMEAHRVELESIHFDLTPYHEQIEALHAQLEPMRDRIAELTAEEHARIRDQMEKNEALMAIEREQMEKVHDEMERIHEEIEPLHEEMERMADRIERALVNDVAAVIRSHLGPVTSPEAEFGEAARRLVEEADIHIDDDVLELDVSRREARQILGDLFKALRIGSEEAFDDALDRAVDDVCNLELSAD